MDGDEGREREKGEGGQTDGEKETEIYRQRDDES